MCGGNAEQRKSKFKAGRCWLLGRLRAGQPRLRLTAALVGLFERQKLRMTMRHSDSRYPEVAFHSLMYLCYT